MQFPYFSLVQGAELWNHCYGTYRMSWGGSPRQVVAGFQDFGRCTFGKGLDHYASPCCPVEEHGGYFGILILLFSDFWGLFAWRRSTRSNKLIKLLPSKVDYLVDKNATKWFVIKVSLWRLDLSVTCHRSQAVQVFPVAARQEVFIEVRFHCLCLRFLRLPLAE